MTGRVHRPLVIFGTGELARLAWFYFSNDSARTVAAFAVDDEYLREERCMDLPVVGYSELEKNYPPAEYDLFVAIGYSRLNRDRSDKCADARARGYRLATYVSSSTIRYPDLQIGDNCLVMEGNIIQPFVSIGDGVILWSGSIISHHVEIGSDCFIAARAVISGKVTIESGCFIGVNATVREGITLARNTLVGAGALVLQSTEQNQSYLGAESKKSGIPSHRLQSLL
jgi:sugar O-acyltransferase (sialic acid O-acetyltransferase NeuD family)